MPSCGDNYPIVRIACFFVMGICAASACTYVIPSTWLWSVWGILLTSYISMVLALPAQQFYRWRSYVGLIGLSAIFWAGFVCRMQCDSKVEDSLSDHVPHMEAYVAVALETLPKESTKKNCKVAVQQVYTHNSWHNIPQTKVQLRIKNDFTNTIQYGDMYLILGYPHPPAETLNPHTFNYKAFLQREGIYYQQHVSGAALQKISHQPPNTLQHFLYRLRTGCHQALTQHISDLQVKAIVLALVLGIKNELDTTLRDAYAGTGTMHILAVSGLHIGILYAILYFLLYWRRRPIAKPWLRDVFACGIIWLYAAITGLSPSVLRAAAMFSLVSVARLIGKQSHVYNVLATSAIFLLLYQPLLLASVSFQLSYIAVAGIVYLQPKIYDRLQVKNFILRRLWMWTSVSLAAQIAVAPISTYYFHQFPVYFMVANWVVVPAAFLIFSLGVVLLVTSPWSIISLPLSRLLEHIIIGMNKWVMLIHQLPFSTIHMYIAVWQVMICYGILVSALLFLHTRTFKSFILLSILTLTLAIGSIHIAVQRNRQRSIIFYSVSPHTAIAFIDGMYGLLLADKALCEDPKTMNYQLHPSLLARGIDDYQAYSFDEVMGKQHMPWQAYEGMKVGIWQGKKIILIDQALPSYPAGGKKMVVDFLVLEKNCVKSLSQLVDRFEIQTLVIGASNSKQRAQQLANEAKHHQMHYHNLRTQGALEITW